MGGADWYGGLGEQEDDESIETIARALEIGCNWIDTASAYGLGHSEGVVRRALSRRGQHEPPYIFTKCGISWDKCGTQSRVWGPRALKRDADDSLRRLGIEQIDLLQIHWPGEDGATVEDAWGAMADLVETGKVRWIGVSNFSVDLLDRCEAVRHVDTVQSPLSLIARGSLDDVIPWALAHGAGVLAYSPLQSGILSGRFSRDWLAHLDAVDARRRILPEFKEPRLSRNLELARRIGGLATQLGCSTAELAIAWVLAAPGVTAAIVGARRATQIAGWAGACGFELDNAVLDQIQRIITDTGAGDGPARFPLPVA
jgi:aryl-alcohol dehydrogenase-like predicted oxidoreductase